jgi:hypothetical protein
MLKLPKKLPPLGETSFILANPEWMQLSIVIVFCLLAPLSGLIWVGANVLQGQAGSAHYAAAGIMALVLAAGLYPRNWQRWVVFAADPKGIYLASFDGSFHHVAWPNVGPSTIDLAGMSSNRQRTVILQLKVDDATWGALLGGRKRRVNAPADAQGFRPFGIGNAARREEDTQQQIEALRPSTAKVYNFSNKSM